ncbi:MAG: P-type conjugative transfer protein TrbG [Devosia sp.]|nr:P-type conjugative transfer protein TrbG [Devosia sp.]
MTITHATMTPSSHATPLLVLAAALCSLGSVSAQEMSVNEAKGTYLSGEWQEGQGVVTRGPDGKVIFLFGEVQPSVVCSPLQVCDIELQAGEVVRDVLVGDSVRWKVDPATSGAAGAQAVHLIVKPSEAGIETSMVVTTSRRTYHVQLRSHATEYMARIGFEYPDDVAAKLDEINARMEASVIDGAGVPAENLDFGFRVEGAARWKPTRIYTDGLKTYIQFPSALAGGDAPVLFVISGGENRIVNYRLLNNMMVVDYLVDHAVLVSGVGREQQKITIRRGT